ncbi:MAG: TAXI family TRAP transporter solute-binding subunit [Chloroflexi bacterium]|nr:TAXI family TRAP transporter solute-binding subunit [Chloroflexota bacterium]
MAPRLQTFDGGAAVRPCPAPAASAYPLALGLAALAAAIVVACAPAPSAAQPPAAQSAAAPQPAAKAAAPQPAAPAAPAAETPKPAAPAQPKAEAKPAQPKAEAKPAAPAAEKLRILFGSASTSSPHYPLFVATVKVWNAKAPEVEATNTANGGCADTLRQMEAKQVLAGVACPDMAYRAWHGLEEFKGKESRALRFLYVYTRNPQAWLVRKDSGIAKLEDLSAKDFNPGGRGSGSEKQTETIFDALGIKPRYYRASTEDATQAVRDRRIVGYTLPQPGATQSSAATIETHRATPLDMLGLTAEQEKKLVESFPYYAFVTVEKDGYGSGFPSRAVRALAATAGVALHKDVPEDIAYKLTKASMDDNGPRGEGVQAAGYAAVKGLDFAQLGVDSLVTPLHAGAARYYKELGKQLKPEQVPPDAK